MTASEHMAGLVEAYGQAVHETAQPDSAQADGRVHDDTRTALLAAIGEIERARDAQAERLAAFDSCDRARRAAEEEVAALKADADRLYDATGFDVDGIIAHDEAMDVQVAALKAEVASLSARFEEACADATRAEADRDAWHNIANKHEADAERLAGVAREACDFAAAAMDNAPCADSHDDADQSALYAGRERIATLRASIPTPDPAAFVAAVERLMDACAVNARLPDSAPDDPAASPGMAEEIAAKAALLAMGGVR